MRPTEILSSEHRVIERVLGALDVAAGRIDAGQAVRPGFFVDAVRFIRDFADGYHHGKEEGVLFEALAQLGMPTNAGPVGMMLHEHTRARELTAGLDQAATRLAAGEDVAHVVVDYARAYVELLTQHIFKEDRILFSMAAQMMPPGEDGRVLDAFARVEDDQVARGSKESFIALAQALCEEIGFDPEMSPRPAVGPPCHAY
jgi:hemerythrin-like domain-containing protein